MAKLTASRINAATYPADKGRHGKVILWDHKIEGLGVRINPSGSKVWVLRYRDAARKRRLVKLGPYGTAKDELNIGRARAKAERTRAKLQRGKDPLDEKEALEFTFGELCDAWLEEWAKPRLKRWRNEEYRIERRLRPALGLAPAAALPRDVVLALHTKVGVTEDKPVEANQILNLISRIIEWGRDAGKIPDEASNPSRRLKRRRFTEERKRDRTLSLDELADLREVVDRARFAFTRAIVWLLLLTGLRKTELLSLEWSRVNLGGEPERRDEGLLPARSLHLPPHLNKSGRPFTTPLALPAVRILAALEAESPGSPWVFPGTGAKGHLVDISRAWSRIRAELERPSLTVHDLRATFATLNRNRGEDIGVIARMLNHRASGPLITQRYLDELPFERIRNGAEAHAKILLEALGVEDSVRLVWPDLDGQADNVVEFRR